MRKLFFISFVLLAVLATAQTTQNPDYLTYIALYKQAAVDQEIAHKIPAPITLAQGLLESAAGKSVLAVNGNNHFGIKCHSEWTGDTLRKDDDQLNECFRKYDDPARSYEDHSLFLQRPRYKALYDLAITDYKAWARGLKACGYATDPNYATKLIKLIEDYDLVAVCEATKFTSASKEKEETVKQQAEEKKTAAKETSKKATEDAKMTAPAEKKTSKKSTKQTKTQSAEREKNIVDEAFSQQQADTQAETLTQEAPKKKARRGSAKVGHVDLYIGHPVHHKGAKKYIIAEAGDTYRGIASEFNIELNRLLRYNGVSAYDKPKSGEVIYLNCKKR